eukprot:5571730-Prymnesium_polylepis.1
MSGGYALVEGFNPAFYTLGDIAKITEERFLDVYGTKQMYLPPQDHSHLAQPTVGQPTVGGPGYKAWADYEDEENDIVPWDHWENLQKQYEDLKAQDSQDSQQGWTE